MPSGPVKISHKKDGRIDFMFLGHPLARPLDPLLGSARGVIHSRAQVVGMYASSMHELVRCNLNSTRFNLNSTLIELLTNLPLFTKFFQQKLYMLVSNK